MENKDKRQRTSPENAKSSTGPRTENGKARSSQNATSHGAYSQKLILPGEDENALNQLIQNHIDRFQPQDQLEHMLVVQMAQTLWRSFRIAPAEASLILIQMHRMTPAINIEFTSVTSADAFALATAQLHSHGQGPTHLTRLEARLQRQYNRLLRQLIEIRQNFPAQPPVQHPQNQPEQQPEPTHEPTAPPENKQTDETKLTPAPNFNPAAAIFHCLPPVASPATPPKVKPAAA